MKSHEDKLYIKPSKEIYLSGKESESAHAHVPMPRVSHGHTQPTKPRNVLHI